MRDNGWVITSLVGLTLLCAPSLHAAPPDRAVEQGAKGAKAARETAVKPDVAISISEDGKETATGLREGDRAWVKPAGTAQVKRVSDVPVMPLYPPLDIAKLTVAQYNGAVSAAMEAMREMMGAISPAEEQKFSAKWAPLFNFPTREAVEYFNKLNPLLSEFLSLRAALMTAALEFDGAWEESVIAAGYESEEGTREALAIAASQKDFMALLQARLAELASEISRLGNPPSPAVAQETARRKHKDAVAATERLIPAIRIVPAKGSGVPGVALTFTPKGRELPKDTKVQWVFGDGDSSKKPWGPVQHTFAKEGKFTVTATALDDAGKPVCQAKSVIDIAKAAAKGAWVFQKAYDKKIPPPAECGGYKINAEMGPNAFGINVSAQGTIFSGGEQHVSVDYKFRVTWNDPPKQLAPDTTFVFSLKAEESLRLGGPPHYDLFYNADRPSVSLASDRLTDPNPKLRRQHNQKDERTGLTLNMSLGSANPIYWKNRPKDTSHPPPMGVPGETSGEAEHTIYVPDGKPGETLGLQVTGHNQLNLHHSFEYDAHGVAIDKRGTWIRVYLYAWTDDPSKAPAEAAADPAALAAEAERKIKEERIFTHETNVLVIGQNLERDRADLAKETDPARRASLEFRILQAQSDIQAEKDLIASIRTGTIVHTRSPFDDYAHDQFIRNIRENQLQMVEFQRATAALQRLAGMLPREEAEGARDFIDRQLDSGARAKMDVAKVRQIAEALHNKVTGYHQAEAAKSEEKAALANLGLEASQNMKSAADTGMMVCSFFGGQGISAAYDIATGYVEGGPVEGVLRAVALLSEPAQIAVDAFKGYREGGWSGAVEKAGFTFLLNRSVHYMLGKPKGDPGKKMTVKEQFELAQFQQARKDGESLVKDFWAAEKRLQAAGKAGASAREIQRLQDALRCKATAIHASPHAKNYLKYKFNPGTRRAYNACMSATHAEVEAKFHDLMKRKGWSQAQLKEFRNAASNGSVGMDFDIGLDKAGAAALSRAKGKGPADIHTWQKDAEKAWKEAYHDTTGWNADMSWETVTNPTHKESYADLAWLGSDKSKVQAAWGQQTADVTRYKANHVSGDKHLSRLEKLQEISRGTAKDMGTKMQPLLKRAKPSSPASAEALEKAQAHWEEVQQTLEAFGNGSIDPITAQRRIREMTGGKSIPEVVEDAATLMEGLIKNFGAK